MELLSGGEMLVRFLRDEGVKYIYGYPGGALLHVYDALFKEPDVTHILVRHEQAATHMADGYARATGKAGVVLVTSGPGATNAITGIATAYMDSIPMVIISGQVPSTMVGTDAFQETDMIGISRPIVKHSFMIKHASEIPEVMKKAFYLAQSGRPGPVVVDIPKDMTNPAEKFEYVFPKKAKLRSYSPALRGHSGQIRKAAEMLLAAKRPVLYAGGGVILGGGSAPLTELAKMLNLPVTNTLMGLGAYPGTDRQFVGMLGMHGSYTANMAMHNADVILAVGARFDDRVINGPSKFCPNAKIIHVDIDAAAISRNVVVDVPIVADAKTALEHMMEWVEEKDTSEWLKQIEQWQQENPLEMRRDKGMSPQMIMEGINKTFANDDATYVTDVGQHQMWASQFLDVDEKHHIITSGGLGTMGFGFPAALGAKMGNPEKDVICITGDGGFQMNMQEMATSVVQKAPVIVCILNNYYLGMVRQMQQLFYGKRYAATCLRRQKGCPDFCKGPNDNCPPYVPDFMQWAKSYGAHSIRVTKEEEILPALEYAKNNKDASTVIEFMIATEDIVLPMVPGGKAMNEMILKA